MLVFCKMKKYVCVGGICVSSNDKKMSSVPETLFLPVFHFL